MKKYRIPYHMFLKWFVPYPPAQSAAMALGLLIGGAVFWLLKMKSYPVVVTLGFGLLCFLANGIYGYHRHVSWAGCLGVAILGWLVAGLPVAASIPLKLALGGAAVVGASLWFRYQRYPA